MCEYLTNRLISRKSCVRLFVGSTAFLIVVCFSAVVAQAGCSHHGDQRSPDLPDGVARIYEGGRFYYYKLVPPPCKGSHCEGHKPNTMATMPSITNNDRQNSLTFVGASRVISIRKPSRFYSELASSYSSPTLDGLLRPPV